MKKILKYMSFHAAKKNNIISNTCFSQEELNNAKNIILELQRKTALQIENGYGPFLAAIYDDKNNLIASMPNTVVNDCNCLHHAEINTISAAQKELNSYDLSKFNLSIYITAEPCIMCAGAILWSGIKKVFYGVSSKDVEEITGFDEGYKPEWMQEFKKRNILVCGNIEEEIGKNVLKNYVKTGKTIYKPERFI